MSENTINVMKHLKLLGLGVRDKVTGFQGICTSICFDLYGCIQALVNPGLNQEGKVQDSLWFDVERLSCTCFNPVMYPPDFEFGAVAEGKRGAAEKPSTMGKV
jgi:hypothetical protein